jgi:hypothetical protein
VRPELLSEANSTKLRTTFANGNRELERVRVDRLSSELAQRELIFYRAKRAIVVVVQSKYQNRSNCRWRTTSPGCMLRTGISAVKIRNPVIIVFGVL